MNNLVDYGSDSDEEGNSSLPEEIEEDFEQGVETSTPEAGGGSLVEPRPPKRPSDEDDKSDQSADESDIDNAVKEGMTALKFMVDDMLMDGEPGTPRSNNDSEGDDATLKPTENLIEMPPSPPGNCEQEIHNRFVKFFDKKAQGMKMNENIKSHKNFKNPALYEFLIAKYNIDEKGSNFHSKIFNPHRFKKEDFYINLAEEQQKLHERMTKSAEAKKSAALASTTTANNHDASKAKKSRFNAK